MLRRWRIKQTDLGTLHLVGFNPATCMGRVSSAVRYLDAMERYCITGSGRRYELQGPPGHEAETRPLWLQWALANGLACFADVTAELFRETGGEGNAIQ